MRSIHPLKKVRNGRSRVAMRQMAYYESCSDESNPSMKVCDGV
jgi:hypothetical protein